MGRQHRYDYLTIRHKTSQAPVMANGIVMPGSATFKIQWDVKYRRPQAPRLSAPRIALCSALVLTPKGGVFPG